MHMLKRAIPPTMNMAWTFILIHASLLWTDTERVLTNHLSLSLSGPMQWNIWYGHTNLLFQQMFGRASLPWNIYPGSALTIWISSTVMCGNVQSLSLKYTLTSNFPSGITSSIGSFCWTFWQTLLWWWLISVICLSTSSHLNAILFLMICNCVCTGEDMSMLSRLLPWAFPAWA